MKKYFSAAICFFGLIGAARAQSVTLNITAGYLKGPNGVGSEPKGGLLQLIASPSGTFAAPTTSSYVSGDNILLRSFAMNYADNVNPTTSNTLNITLAAANYTLTTGEAVILRFYPGLTFASAPSAPTANSSYGQVRSDTIEFPTTDSDETKWVIPSSGGNVDLNYVTMSDTSLGGTYADNTAYANFTVVPEPSTYGIFGGCFAGIMCLRAWSYRWKMS